MNASPDVIQAAPADNPLVQHAEAELRRAGLFDKDADYGGAIGTAVMDVVRAFAGRGHSGASAMLVLDIFEKVARFQTLTPLTTDPAEWIDRSEISGVPLWQNRRDGRAMSEDGGQTWRFVEG